MVRILPRSLFARTAWLVLLIILISQALSWLVFRFGPSEAKESIFSPLVIGQVRASALMLSVTPPDKKAAVAEQLSGKDGIRLIALDAETVRTLRKPTHPYFVVMAETIEAEPGFDDSVFASPVYPYGLLIKLPLPDGIYWAEFANRNPKNFNMFHPKFLIWIGVLIAIALLSALFIAWRINKPLHRLFQAAQAIGQRQLPPHVEERGPREIQVLNRAFNDMAKDLQQLDNDRHLMLAGISHDLRSPLARMRLAIELLSEQVDQDLRRRLIQDLHNIDNIINQFMHYVQGAEADILQTTDINQVVTEALAVFATSHITIETHLLVLPKVLADPTAIKRVVLNLIDNAIKYAGVGLELQTSCNGSMVCVCMLDRGPGIAEADIHRMRQPFSRLDESRLEISGSGLGLAIIERIAKIHHGHFRIINRTGGGLEVRFEIPVALVGTNRQSSNPSVDRSKLRDRDTRDS